MKKSAYAAVLVLFGVTVSCAGETALDSLRAAVPVSALSVTVAPEVSEGGVEYILKGINNPKIYVTPVTEHWKDVFLVKFNRGVDIKTVMYVLKREGLATDKFADNGDGFYARITIKDEAAPVKAGRLAEYAVVEAVQVNRHVWDMMAGLKEEKNLISPAGKASAQKSSLKIISDTLAARPLPGGCALEVNSYHSSSYGENLNVGIIKGGVFTDILMAGGEVSSASGAGLTAYKYEAVSTEGPGTVWQDHRIKDVFELRVDNWNNILSVTIEKYKEKDDFGFLAGLLGVIPEKGDSGWKKTESITCKK